MKLFNTPVNYRHFINTEAFFMLLLIGAVVYLTYFVMLGVTLYLPVDFNQHFEMMIECIKGGQCNIISYPLYHLSILIIHKLFSINDPIVAGFISASGFQILTTIIIFRLLSRSAGNTHSFPVLLIRSALAFSLIIVAPINLPTWSSGGHYLGYISPNSFHSPTIIALKPFALLSVCYIADLLSVSAEKFHLKHQFSTLKASSMTILSSLAKPSYAICILPILVFTTIATALQKRDKRYWVPLLICTISLLLLLIVQNFFLYPSQSNTDQDIEIVFNPFHVVNYYILGYDSSNIEYRELFTRLMMSVAFPASMTILYYRVAFRSKILIISLSCFFIGSVYTYLFAETGLRFSHGNFGWSGEIGLFLWFCAATIVLYTETVKVVKGKAWKIHGRYSFCWLVFMFHLFCGISFVRCGGCW